MKDLEKVDVVLIMEEPPRIYEAKGTTKQSGSLDPRTDYSPDWLPDHIEWLRGLGAGSQNSFGYQLRNALSLGAGYQVEVTDFNEAISVKITYTNVRTCKSASLHACVVFRTNAGMCNAYINGQRFRTCNNVGQAASYIRNKAAALIGRTTTMES